jgi:hypothetical protein
MNYKKAWNCVASKYSYFDSTQSPICATTFSIFALFDTEQSHSICVLFIVKVFLINVMLRIGILSVVVPTKLLGFITSNCLILFLEITPSFIARQSCGNHGNAATNVRKIQVIHERF